MQIPFTLWKTTLRNICNQVRQRTWYGTSAEMAWRYLMVYVQSHEKGRSDQMLIYPGEDKIKNSAIFRNTSFALKLVYAEKLNIYIDK